ncbi:MAG: type II secretion system F family protein [Candidatus Jorgensenbacteria bacterium]|nr:type II secretion system F family protein [Candidatus Jorgensenbacteria bacterium]
MKFRYIASQADGRVVEGEMDAQNVHEVLAFLAKNNLKPVSIKSKEEEKQGLFTGSITITDQVFITKYLALMLKIGTGLLEAINILIADFKKPAIRDFLFEVRSSLEKGQPFYSTFAKYPKTFSHVYINLVRAGEESGNLEKVFTDLTETLTKQKDLQDTVRGALTYPVILLVGSLGILFFLVMFALPKVSKVFTDGGFQPPAFSAAVFSVGLFFNQYGFYFIGIFVIVALLIVWLRSVSEVFRRFISNVFSNIPLVKGLIKKMALQRFSATLSSLVKAGMPLNRALEITADAVAHEELRAALMRISRDGIAKGLTIGEAFRRESAFPQTITNLIAISEKAGHIDEVLGTVSEFYTKEIDSGVKELVSFLEPALLLFIGIIVALIALAIIVPIYQLTTQF